jgi:hypothetical protein
MMERGDRELFERSLRHRMESPGGDFDSALEEAGWLDALAADQHAAIATVFGLQGATGVSSSALDDVLVLAMGLAADTPAAVILPALGLRAPPGIIAHGTLSARGLGTGAVRRRNRAHLVTERGGQLLAVTADMAALTLRPLSGMDPRLGWVEVSGCVAGRHEHELEPAAWEAAIAIGQLALAHELVGAARTMLTLARDHAVDRVQFGRPIGNFQAVRHRLADSLIDIERADAGLAAAWDDRALPAARMAKALSGWAAHTVARHCQQVLAGIGFTTEHPFHGYLRRVLVLDELLGSARHLTTELGEEIIAARRMPGLPSL